MILALLVPIFGGMFDNVYFKPSVLAKKEPKIGFKLTTKVADDLWFKMRVYEERKNDLTPTDKFIFKVWFEKNF